MTQPDSPEELKEKLAAIEHQRWSDWQKWCNAVIREHIDSPKATEARLKLWDEQIATPYKDLKEYEKDSDREQVERYWPLVEEYYTNKFLKRETELLDALYWIYTQYCGRGHDFMGAGENASELLENAGYIKVDSAGVITVDNGDSQEQAIKQLSKRGEI